MKVLTRWLAFVLVALAIQGMRPAYALDPARSISQFFHTSWTMRDALPVPILSFAQTPDGFLWFGTVTGLYRFDGLKAEPFGEGQLPAQPITSMATTKNGDLWIGFAGTQLARLSNGVVTVWPVPTPGAKTAVSYLAPDADGTLWVATIDTVLHFDGQHWRTIEAPWPAAVTRVDPGGVWGLALGPDGTLWAKNLLGLYCLKRGADGFEQAPGYGGGVIDFARASDGRLWTSDFSTQRFYALPSLEPDKPISRPELGARVPPLFLGAVLMDRDGSVWNVNQITGGLRRLPSVTASTAPDQFQASQGLSSETVIAAFEDREGSVWISTAQGLDRFRPAAIAALSAVQIRAQSPSYVATKDALYVYTGMPARIADPSDAGGRLVRIEPGTAPEVVDDDVGLITALAATPAGDLVLAVENGLLRWRNGETTPIPLRPDMEGGHVSNLVVASNGDIWVSLHGRGVFHRTQDRWTHDTSPSRPTDAPAIALDNESAVWLFYPDLVVRFDHDKKTEFRSVIPKIGRVQASLADVDGIIVVGNEGIARFNGDTFEFILSSRVPALKLVSAIAGTPDGDVWLQTHEGIVRIARASLLTAFDAPESSVDLRLLDALDGFSGSPPGNMFNTQMVLAPDSRIWFFMNPGVTAWIDPHRLDLNTRPPPVVIKSVRANGVAYNEPQALTLPAGVSQLQIDYTAPSLAAPERMRFRYRLEGVDKDWVEAGNRRQAFYTNLEPGNYHFQVIAANNDGVWNMKGATFSAVLPPTFLQSVWFKLLLTLALLALAWLLYTLRVRQQTARLRNQFNTRIAERERIARELHDTLLQGVQGLILRFHALANRAPIDSGLREPMRSAIDRAEQVLSESRARVRELRTTATADDFGQAILEVAKSAISGDSPRFALTIEGAPRSLTQRAEEELLRILEEAIRNSVRHASARDIQVVLSYGRNELALTIRDDGVGISEASRTSGAQQQHFGLLGMRERAERLGGKLKLSSRENGGTEITAIVPKHAAYASGSFKS